MIVSQTRSGRREDLAEGTAPTWDAQGKKAALVPPDGASVPETLTPGSRPEWSSRGRIAYIRGRGISWAPNGKSILVGIEDSISEPVHTQGRLVQVFLDDRGAKQLEASGYMPDWQPKP